MTRRVLRWIVASIAVLAALPAAADAQDPCPGPDSYDSGGPPRTAGPVNDPLYERQWGHTQIRVEMAWRRGFTGNGIIIANLGSGVDLSHPDLAPNLVPGVDTVGGESLSPCGVADDDDGYTTYTAGITSAVADNGIGVAGVAPRARILPVKVCTAVCPWPAIFDGVKGAIDRGAKIIHFHSGSPEIYDYGIARAMVEYAWSRGVIFIGPAGDGSGAGCNAPASAPQALCVAATDRRGLPVAASNPPFNGRTYGVRAPGSSAPYAMAQSAEPLCDEGLWSTQWHGWNNSICGKSYGVAWGSGASAAYVAGVAALLAEAGLANWEVVERLRATSSNRGNTDPVMGYGIVDADAATVGLVPRPAAAQETPAPSGPAPAPVSPPPPTDDACSSAHAVLRREVRRAVAARNRLRRARTAAARRQARRAFATRLRVRNRAQRRLERACR